MGISSPHEMSFDDWEKKMMHDKTRCLGVKTIDDDMMVCPKREHCLRYLAIEEDKKNPRHFASYVSYLFDDRTMECEEYLPKIKT